MKCPVCVEPTLVMSERQGIEIDYCPQCRGIWLDRGELDKLLEKAAVAMPSAAAPAVQPAERAPQRDDRDRGYDDRDRGYDDRDRGYDDRKADPRYAKKKKTSFLSDILDF